MVFRRLLIVASGSAEIHLPLLYFLHCSELFNRVYMVCKEHLPVSTLMPYPASMEIPPLLSQTTITVAIIRLWFCSQTIKSYNCDGRVMSGRVLQRIVAKYLDAATRR